MKLEGYPGRGELDHEYASVVSLCVIQRGFFDILALESAMYMLNGEGILPGRDGAVEESL
jgi:hypothetical protein